jgi:hypothetical protein
MSLTGGARSSAAGRVGVRTDLGPDDVGPRPNPGLGRIGSPWPFILFLFLFPFLYSEF